MTMFNTINTQRTNDWQDTSRFAVRINFERQEGWGLVGSD